MTDEEMRQAGITAQVYGFETSNVRVEHTGTGLWAVRDGAICLNREGAWEYEPQPSSRNAQFFDRCRFSLHDALTLARNLVERS